MTKYYWCFLCLFSFFALAEESKTEKLTNIAIETTNIAGGKFTQQKFFKVLSHPIVSNGELFFDKELGVYWQTEKPIESLLILNEDGLHTANKDQNLTKINGSGALSNLLMNTMVGNIETLKKSFYIQKGKKGQCFFLKPLTKELDTIIEIIELCVKDKLVNKLMLIELSGNKTLIELDLKPLKLLPEKISAQLQ